MQIKKCARDISEKYIAPPYTTDFAILFLPTEGLYAEIIRRTELVQALQRDCRVTVAGPTTSKRNSQNQVLVGDGETAVIGGLTQTQVSRSKSGIPILMDLPGIGRLFSQTDVTERKQDLLILITPHIVDEGEVVKRKP